MALAFSEMIWLKDLLAELRVMRSNMMVLNCDNISTMNIANNPVQHDRTKHIKIDRFFIKENLDSEKLKLNYVRSREQLTDCFTKGLGLGEGVNICNKMGMIDIFSPS